MNKKEILKELKILLEQTGYGDVGSVVSWLSEKLDSMISKSEVEKVVDECKSYKYHYSLKNQSLEPLTENVIDKKELLKKLTKESNK